MDRRKYMDTDEVKQLRQSTANWSAGDLAAGRRQGPLAWMLVDFTLRTGLRVSEIAAVTLADIDQKRQIITVTRVKRKKRVSESLNIDSGLARHLHDYIADQRPTSTSNSLWIGKRGPLSPQGLEVLWKHHNMHPASVVQPYPPIRFLTARQPPTAPESRHHGMSDIVTRDDARTLRIRPQRIHDIIPFRHSSITGTTRRMTASG